jgi:hypothetical protein
MHWILQNNIFQESAYENLIEVLERFEIPYSIHKVVPFVGELIPEPELDTNNVICMGSYSMRHIAKKMGWIPGVFDLEPFDFTHQLKHWGTHMLNHDSIVTRFGDANFDDDAMFIRPIHDSKCFAGKVFDKEEFYTWKRKVCVLEENYGDSLTKDTLIQLCRPKTIYAEYRFWIVNQHIVTASLYKRGNRVIYSSDVDRHVHQFVYEILKTKNQQTDITLSMALDGWAPHDAFVLDVCETDEGMKVVEINTINAAGFYAANMTDLVMALEQAHSK